MYSDDNKANEIIRRFISYVDEATRKPSCMALENNILLGLRSKRSKMPFMLQFWCVWTQSITIRSEFHYYCTRNLSRISERVDLGDIRD
jgi:hypothetical protein